MTRAGTASTTSRPVRGVYAALKLSQEEVRRLAHEVALIERGQLAAFGPAATLIPRLPAGAA